MPLGKQVLQADDFLPEKDWRVLASVGYMCDDPYTGAPGVTQVADGIYRVTTRLATRKASSQITFTLRFMEPFETTRQVFSPLLVQFLSGVDHTTRPVQISVAGLDRLGFDSLWLSEVLTAPVLDPLVGLAWAAASNPSVKLGTTMLLPGRNVVRLAKQLASLDVLCQGRLLVTLVPGLTWAPEREAIGVEPKRRGAFIDEALPLLRRLWAGETVSHDGAAGSFRDVKLWPLPVQQPLEVWLGGTAPARSEERRG